VETTRAVSPARLESQSAPPSPATTPDRDSAARKYANGSVDMIPLGRAQAGRHCIGTLLVVWPALQKVPFWTNRTMKFFFLCKWNHLSNTAPRWFWSETSLP
jgi:hypothetical protein